MIAQRRRGAKELRRAEGSLLVATIPHIQDGNWKAGSPQTQPLRASAPLREPTFFFSVRLCVNPVPCA